MPEKIKQNRDKLLQLLSSTHVTVFKYLFSAALIFLGCRSAGNIKILFCGLLELVEIWLISESLRSFRVRFFVNGILLLLLNSQALVYLFGGDFISLVMLTNLDNVQDLSGKLFIYIPGIIFTILISFIPTVRLINRLINYRTLNKRDFNKQGLNERELNAGNSFRSQVFASRLLSLVLCAELLFSLLYGNLYSPFFAYWRLVEEAGETARVRKELETVDNRTLDFYREGVSGISVDKPESLGELPNIVLILTEGLSEHIIKDERGIMPNAASLEEKSLSFSSYYNHTFATYRGISGQLYSGYQLDNYDSNSLIGIQDILKDNGYNTSFINTEPNLVPFTNYLHDMGFDEVIGDPGHGYSGPSGSMTDREAYSLLMDHIEEKYAEGRPFFTAIYTFGTHASFDSPDRKFQDGSLSELNKFYNADYWLGDFIQKLENSPAFDNTIVVFTADHAAYADLYYYEAFPDYERAHPALDQIPLIIYYKDVQPQVIDSAGRNSLDLTSTILDFIDIDGPNYFLGTSLFYDADNYNNLDTIFTSSVDLYSSENSVIRRLEETEAETAIVTEMIRNYYAAKLQTPKTP